MPVSPRPADFITIDKPIRIDRVLVPAGYFLMGTRVESIPGLLKQYGVNKEWYESEVSQHQVYLHDFYIAKVPVPVEQFCAFFMATGYQTTAEQEGWGWLWQNDQWEKVPDATWQHPEVRPYDWTRKWSEIMKRRGGLAWRPGRSRLLWGVDPIVGEIAGMSNQFRRPGFLRQPLALELGWGQVS